MREEEDSAVFYVVAETTIGGEAEFSVGGLVRGRKDPEFLASRLPRPFFFGGSFFSRIMHQ